MIITICGSYKFKEKMFDVYKQLTESGHMVFLPAIDCDKHDKEWYMDLHYKKIAKSDAIYVVDVDSYVGMSTNMEMYCAKVNKKEIFRYSNHDLGVV